MGNRRSYTDEELRRAVADNESMAGALRALGLAPRGGNYQSTRVVIEALGLDTSHWRGQGHLKGRTCSWTRARPLEEILVASSDYPSRYTLKRRLLKAGLLPQRCAVEACQFHRGPLLHVGKPVVLHLDHINGDNRDHRLENLRLLCPLCHSQTDTYAGRNAGRYLRANRTCVACGEPTTRTLRCGACRARLAAGGERRTTCQDCGEPLRSGRVRCAACHIKTLAKGARSSKRKKTEPKACADCGRAVGRKSTRCAACAHRRSAKIEWPAPEELAARVQRSSLSAVSRELGVSGNAVRKRLRNTGLRA